MIDDSGAMQQALRQRALLLATASRCGRGADRGYDRQATEEEYRFPMPDRSNRTHRAPEFAQILIGSEGDSRDFSVGPARLAMVYLKREYKIIPANPRMSIR